MRTLAEPYHFQEYFIERGSKSRCALDDLTLSTSTILKRKRDAPDEEDELEDEDIDEAVDPIERLASAVEEQNTVLIVGSKAVVGLAIWLAVITAVLIIGVAMMIFR